jgi:uncharacterized membrane protein YeiH
MLELLVAILDGLGLVVFATTGALVASRKEMDVVGFALLGTVTGIGGGSLRDLLLGTGPVFWVRDPTPLLICVGVSVLVFATAHIPQSRYRLLLWLDALGLALFAVVGAEKALEAGAGPVVAVAMGVITATFGGVLRDVLGGERPVVLSPEIYVTAALIGAALTVAALAFGLPREVALSGGFVGAFVTRGAALLRGWTLPRYRPRPGRDAALVRAGLVDVRAAASTGSSRSPDRGDDAGGR